MWEGLIISTSQLINIWKIHRQRCCWQHKPRAGIDWRFGIFTNIRKLKSTRTGNSRSCESILSMVNGYVLNYFGVLEQIANSWRPRSPSASEMHCFDESQPAPPNRNLPSAGRANAQAVHIWKKHSNLRISDDRAHHPRITTLKRHVNMFDSNVWLNLMFSDWFPGSILPKKRHIFFLLVLSREWMGLGECDYY